MSNEYTAQRRILFFKVLFLLGMGNKRTRGQTLPCSSMTSCPIKGYFIAVINFEGGAHQSSTIRHTVHFSYSTKVKSNI